MLSNPSVDENHVGTTHGAEDSSRPPHNLDGVKLPLSALLGGAFGQSPCCLALGFILGWLAKTGL